MKAIRRITRLSMFLPIVALFCATIPLVQGFCPHPSPQLAQVTELQIRTPNHARTLVVNRQRGPNSVHLSTPSGPLFVSLGTPEASDDNANQTTKNKNPLLSLATSPLGALALLSMVVMFHESGHFLAAKALGVPVDEFSIGLGPKLWGTDTFSLRLIPLGGYVSLNRLALAALPWPYQIDVMAAGVMFNCLLALVIYASQIMWGPGLTVAVYDEGLTVAGFREDKHASAKGLLQKGDVIKAVNGKSILDAPTSSDQAVQRAMDKLIAQIQATQPGQHVIFTTIRSGQVRNITVKPEQIEDGQQSVGVFLQPNLIGIDNRQSENPFEAMAWAASHVATQTQEIAIGLDLAHDGPKGHQPGPRRRQLDTQRHAVDQLANANRPLP